MLLMQRTRKIAIKFEVVREVTIGDRRLCRGAPCSDVTAINSIGYLAGCSGSLDTSNVAYVLEG